MSTVLKLKLNDKVLFTAERCAHNRNTMVHNKPIPEGFGKFRIQSVMMRKAVPWMHYDPTKHVPNAYIVWKLKDTAPIRLSKYEPEKDEPMDYQGADVV